MADGIVKAETEKERESAGRESILIFFYYANQEYSKLRRKQQHNYNRQIMQIWGEGELLVRRRGVSSGGQN